MNTRTVLEKYIACMQSGDNVALADLFDKHGVSARLFSHQDRP